MKARLLEVYGKLREPAGRGLLVVLGIVLGQVILYGPSLAGRKILLPLDLLAQENFYLPRTAENTRMAAHDMILTDEVLQFEPDRQFAVAEVRAGRLPCWSPYEFCGVPCYQRCSFSLPCLPKYWFAAPVVLAWTQLLVALVAGAGCYVFCRRALGVAFWPAAIVAWCYPLTGTYIVWQGYIIPLVVCWLPWVLTAVDASVRRPLGWGPPALALLTTAALVSGATDMGGQVLLASGLYAVWRIFDEYGRQRKKGTGTICRNGPEAGTLWVRHKWYLSPFFLSAGLTGLAWTLGILASTWFLLPLLDYTRTGARMMRRSLGEEERPPGSLALLPQVVLPEFYGLTLDGSFYVAPGSGNVPESPVAGYAGLWAALLVAPLAWCRRSYRSINLLWMLLLVVSLSWAIDVPGMVWLLRRPGLNLMSHNRFVFLTAFVIMAMAAEGLDVLFRREAGRRWWFLLPMLVLVALAGWCVYRTASLPEPLASNLEAAVRNGVQVGGLHDLEGVVRVQQRFLRYYATSAAMAALGAAAWFLLWARPRLRPWHTAVLGGMMVAELLWFGYGYSPQCDPGLYYPPVKVLDEVAKAPPGRIIGYRCLPAKLGQVEGLRDVRGYDAVDPARMVALLLKAADPGYQEAVEQKRVPTYAVTQWLLPRVVRAVPPAEVRLSPILEMLGVRYVIFRGTPPREFRPAMQGDDYWVLTDSQAMPRAFVPTRVETVADDADRLNRLASPDFDPRRLAYVESPVSLPSSCLGTVSVTEENPTQLTLSADMESAGLVVLADHWDQGWKAYLDGEPVPILRTNHALRGVVLPAGQQTVHMRYEPASLRWGLRITGIAGLLGLGWVVLLGLSSGYRRRWGAASPAAPQPAAAGQAASGKGQAERTSRLPRHPGRRRRR
jgi:hypothetical protein